MSTEQVYRTPDHSYRPDTRATAQSDQAPYAPRIEPVFPEGWSLTGPLPDEFRGLSPSELENERGRYQMLSIDATDERDRAVWEHKLAVIDRHIARYQRHGVKWPNRKRTDDLVQLAHELKAAVPLEQFIAEQVQTTRLERVGETWKGLCPFHDEKTPSFHVYPDGGWKCFGCGKKGDIYHLIGLHFGIPNFPDQVALLADYYGRGIA